MKPQTFIQVVDKAAQMCGSLNALARQIEVDSGDMSKYRAGKRSVPVPVIERLAEVAGEDAADVWLLAQDARNPLRLVKSYAMQPEAPVSRGFGVMGTGSHPMRAAVKSLLGYTLGAVRFLAG